MPVDLVEILRNVYEQSLDGIVISDPQTVIIDVNAAYCEMTGYSREELIGQRTNVIRSGATPRETFTDMWQQLSAQGKWVGELINRHKDGTLWWSYISITRIVGADGQVVAYVGLSRDITERRRMEEQLRAMDRMKSEFIATVSHELRTPMTAIKGSLGLALAGAAGSLASDLRELLTIAMNNSDRLIRLINDILDLSRIEAGKLNLRLSPTDLAAVTLRSVAELDALAAQKQIAVQLRLPEHLPAALADADRIGQVLVNLLSNALKFTDAGGQVGVNAERTGNWITMQVSDSGIGIPREHLKAIFERFHRVDNAASRRTGGTGLGLAICQAIVAEHGGRIWVESQPGKGSIFSFTLPVAR